MNPDYTPNVEEEVIDDSVLYDMDKFQFQEHRHDRIIGNQLMCSMHDSVACPKLTIKPTEVLIINSEGVMELVDNAP